MSPFKPEPHQPSFADLIVSLSNSKAQVKDNAMYQTVFLLLQRITTSRDLILQQIDELNEDVSALKAASFLTINDETFFLLNSRRLLAGLNITFDDTLPGKRFVNAAGNQSLAFGLEESEVLPDIYPALPVIPLQKYIQHPLTAYEDEANVFTANQTIQPTRGELIVKNGSGATAFARIAQYASGVIYISANLSFDGTNFNFDNTAVNGEVLILDPASTGMVLFHAAASANPATLGSLFQVTTAGIVNVISGQVQFPAVQNPSANANILDDYEEGSWTPVIGGSGGTSGQTYSTQVGRYIKIGKMVFCQFHTQFSAKGTITANVEIQGLPFTSENTTGNDHAFAISWDSFATNWVDIMGDVAINATTAIVTGAQAAAANNHTQVLTADLNNTSELLGTFFYRATA